MAGNTSGQPDQGNYSGQDPSFQRKGAKMQSTQRRFLFFFIASRPLQLGVFALEADWGG